MSFSTNGFDWYPLDNPFTEITIRAIAYGNNMFVASSMSGSMAYSFDGEHWSLSGNYTFGTNSIETICYGDNKFIAAGYSGIMGYSTDGKNWTIINNSPFVFLRLAELNL